jgi:hypothetical protein
MTKQQIIDRKTAKALGLKRYSTVAAGWCVNEGLELFLD